MSKLRHLKFAREAARQAERYGFQEIQIDYGHAHPVLRGTVNGAPVRVVIPRTPSDWRGRRNCFAGMRRLARGGRL